MSKKFVLSFVPKLKVAAILLMVTSPVFTTEYNAFAQSVVSSDAVRYVKSSQILAQNKQIETDDIEQQILDAISDIQLEDDGVRYKALDRLIQLGPKAAPAVPYLSKLLEDGKSIVSVTQALAAIGDAAIPSIRQALKSPNRVVRFWAANTLPTTSDAASGLFDSIIEATHDQSACIRSRAIRGLASYGSSSLSYLIESSEDDDADVRASVNTILGHIRIYNRDTTDVLVRGMRDPEPMVRVTSAAAMSQSNSETSTAAFLPILIQAVRDKNPLVRESVAVALKNIHFNNKEQAGAVLSALREMESDVAQPVRFWARAGIIKMKQIPRAVAIPPKIYKWDQSLLEGKLCPEKEPS
ncbi:HEAT repeat domain-containing protein [Gloeobacter kilaueensis]|uniref:Oxidoreductase/HEAT repeat-containing protein n=1 Tax=Gloeobacter kilaueensis (strain ATCC BAA-2537 / CCAP 1431/1 / ULC 316 / JS1) TaxID=1183438 RepID=U5QDF5_GLOK1|nr:HEAT repeat domain-containing protein [Gloeobacter kilaueensis]AGY56868.1 oxidoreductase/HEAT repeat-containing protein [Gloeobacter kilaueensis JS1]